jgi:hypothetical protein
MSAVPPSPPDKNDGQEWWRADHRPRRCGHAVNCRSRGSETPTHTRTLTPPPGGRATSDKDRPNPSAALLLGRPPGAKRPQRLRRNNDPNLITARTGAPPSPSGQRGALMRRADAPPIAASARRLAGNFPVLQVTAVQQLPVTEPARPAPRPDLPDQRVIAIHVGGPPPSVHFRRTRSRLVRRRPPRWPHIGGRPYRTQTAIQRVFPTP